MKFASVLFIAACAFGQAEWTERERAMLERIEKLERRLSVLEAAAKILPAAATPAATAPVPVVLAPSTEAARLPDGLTVNVGFDGYYGYNFNRPASGTNALRAYDVSSNGFGLNQAGLIVERAPDVAKGRRVGARLDLMFGQATETLQGSAANERRPEVYRHIFQAYGTYVAPVGSGLTVDFGKWANTFGLESNYTKDQFNYSRSYFFNLFPYYHMGMRASYPVTDKLEASYWLTNGANQTEDFNGFKSQAVLLRFTPARGLAGGLNYFNGQEQRMEDGRTPRGRTHYMEGYATWEASERLTLAAQVDYVVSRVEPWGAAKTAAGGAGYVRYRFHPRFSLAGRAAYLDDAGGCSAG